VFATFQLVGEQERIVLHTGPVPISRPPAPAPAQPVWGTSCPPEGSVAPDSMGSGTPQPWDLAWLEELAGPHVVWTTDAQIPSLRLGDVPSSSQLFHLVSEHFARSCRNGPTQLPLFDVDSVKAVHNARLSSAFLLGLQTTDIRRGACRCWVWMPLCVRALFVVLHLSLVWQALSRPATIRSEAMTRAKT